MINTYYETGRGNKLVIIINISDNIMNCIKSSKINYVKFLLNIMLNLSTVHQVLYVTNKTLHLSKVTSHFHS